MAQASHTACREMRIAIAQMDIVWEKRQDNLVKAAAFAEDAAKIGADFFVLPEMFSTGFSMNPQVTAEHEDGETATFLKSLAKRHRMGVLGGITLKGSGNRARNAALAVDRDGRDLAIYVKTHLFKYLGEDRAHEPGHGLIPFGFEGMRCACAICYDLRFPELFRQVVDACDVIFVIASWPESRQSHFDILLSARAVENQLYIVGANRVGQGGGLSYAGGSAIIAPDGEVLAHHSREEGLVMAAIDVKRVQETRVAFPFLDDRR